MISVKSAPVYKLSLVTAHRIVSTAVVRAICNFRSWLICGLLTSTEFLLREWGRLIHLSVYTWVLQILLVFTGMRAISAQLFQACLPAINSTDPMSLLQASWVLLCFVLFSFISFLWDIYCSFLYCVCQCCQYCTCSCAYFDSFWPWHIFGTILMFCIVFKFW